ncbi:MAG: amidohydrolase family protein [Gammaproteobacteria bacterium]
MGLGMRFGGVVGVVVGVVVGMVVGMVGTLLTAVTCVALMCVVFVVPTARADIVIRPVAVFDGVGAFVPGQAVVVRDDRIIAVQSATAGVPAAAQVIDGGNRFLLPGFWDAHVHYDFIPELDHRSMSTLFLINGITSVRDTGGHLDVLAPARAAAAAPDAPAPRLFVAGPLLDAENRVYAGSAPGFPDIADGVTTRSAADEIDALAAAGVDLIKTYELVDPALFAALIERARHHGLPVTAHIPLSMDGLDVAASGIRGMEHLRNLELACSRDHAALLADRLQRLTNPAQLPGWQLRRDIHAAQRLHAFESEDPTRCAELIRALATHRVFQTPTLTITSADVARLPGQPAYRDTFDLLPPAVRTRWHQDADARLAAPPAALAQAHTRWATSMVPRLHAAGVPIMAGTDTPIGLLTPGFSLHEELRMLVEAGMPAAAVLIAATRRPAEFLGREDDLGTVAPGKLADLVLLDADPLVDIRNTRRIAAVMRGGRLFDRAALDALAAGLRAEDAPQ